jgi:hypothetical protein
MPFRSAGGCPSNTADKLRSAHSQAHVHDDRLAEQEPTPSLTRAWTALRQLHPLVRRHLTQRPRRNAASPRPKHATAGLAPARALAPSLHAAPPEPRRRRGAPTERPSPRTRQDQHLLGWRANCAAHSKACKGRDALISTSRIGISAARPLGLRPLDRGLARQPMTALARDSRP